MGHYLHPREALVLILIQSENLLSLKIKMTLYKADFLELKGEPVKSTKKGKKVSKEVEPEVEPERPTEGGKQLPVKKPKTEKQLAALERARENRKRKREEQEALAAKEVEDAKKAIADKEAEIAQKKAEQKEKRRLKKEAKQKAEQENSAPSNDGVSEAVDNVEVSEAKPVKERKPKKAKVVSSDEPPAWFKKYIQGNALQANALSKEKQPEKKIIKESNAFAAEAWKDDLTRDRVNQEQDNHMARMYSSIFGSKLKL